MLVTWPTAVQLIPGTAEQRGERAVQVKFHWSALKPEPSTAPCRMAPAQRHDCFSHTISNVQTRGCSCSSLLEGYVQQQATSGWLLSGIRQVTHVSGAQVQPGAQVHVCNKAEQDTLPFD
jgi:hypothetical protein